MVRVKFKVMIRIRVRLGSELQATMKVRYRLCSLSCMSVFISIPCFSQ